MDALYSLSLLVSLIAGGVAVALAVIEHVPGFRARLPGPAGSARSVARGVVLLTSLSLAAGVLSFFVHLNWGHGPNASEPMSFVGFLGAHPAYFLAGLLVASAVFLHAVRPRAG